MHQFISTPPDNVASNHNGHKVNWEIGENYGHQEGAFEFQADGYVNGVLMYDGIALFGCDDEFIEVIHIENA